MRITLVGHLSVDVNVVGGVARTEVGGGVFYGGVAARRLGAEVEVLTKAAPADVPRFGILEDVGVAVRVLPSATSTSIRNDYPTTNPDDRVTRMISRAAPFAASDLADLDVDVLHVNPLWFGEFPSEVLSEARRHARLLAADAQGFVRNVLPDGATTPRDWDDKARWLPLLDVFKVDAREALALTGIDQPVPAALRLRELGVRTVLLTHQGGVCVACEEGIFEAPFSSWTLEGRTGRGDTCTAAFLVALPRGPAEATRFAARVTSAKMQLPGPFRGLEPNP